MDLVAVRGDAAVVVRGGGGGAAKQVRGDRIGDGDDGYQR
jgi:hypothetical protein